jgi:hypothetical protein
LETILVIAGQRGVSSLVSLYFMASSQITFGAWIASIGLLAILGVVLFTRGVWRRYPLFTAYVLADLLQALTLYGLRNHESVYVYTYWPFELTTMFLGLGVVYEIFKNLLAAYSSLSRIATILFEVSLVVLVLTGCIVMFTQPPVAGSRFVAAFVVIEQGVRIIEVGLLVALFLFSSAFGLHWKQHIFGIGLGLAVFTAVALAGAAFRARLGPQMMPWIILARQLSFGVSLLVWFGYLLIPEQVTIGSQVPQRGQLEQWNRAVKELIYQ